MAQLAGGTGTPARWVEELPHDVEAIGDQGGLRGSLSDGSLVVARAVAARSSEESRRLVAHLKRLSQLRDPHLLPVRGAVVEGDTVWVLSEYDRGSPLSELLRRRPPPSALAAAIGIDVLAGLAALQRAGLVHGALHAGNVHVGRDGRTRLGDYALRPRFRPGDERLGWGDPRNDVVAVGVLLCTVLAVPVTPEPGDLREAERTTPALVATARALAAGRGGRNARAALAGVRAAAGHLADPGLRRRELGALAVAAAGSAAAATGRAGEPVRWAEADVPSPLPSPPASPGRESEPPPFPPEPQPLASAPPDPPAPAAPARPPLPVRRPVAWAAGAVLVVVLLSALAATALRPAASRGTVRTTARPAPATASAAAAASPSAQVPATAAEPTAPAAQQAGADSPEGAVARFYELVAQHDFDRAVQLWSPRLRASYPPGENVYGRFAHTTSVQVARDQVSSAGAGQAVVSVDLYEVRGGRTYHWTGSWYLVRQDSGWLLDMPALSGG